ncbi:twin-arginine translocation signal domain-containing protein [Kordiimonas aquimaris]|uniref:twin-arginine translocation signal domain-containing protein n=1 Tax=Kordiimonas aquimaris TaxID=707591 RepID=UPI0021D38CAE|nr:twin-arginine translocation signal domain-containing protein [Kordiimonas aquimaris]
MNRRDFIKTVSCAAGLSAAASLPARSHLQTPKKVLFLGGRLYAGPYMVRALIAAGHEVTISNRGITNPHLFPELSYVWCDREQDQAIGLAALLERVKLEKFDWVVDTWQKHPAAVRDTARLLSHYIPFYHYVSTISVYRDWNKVGISENYPIKDLSAGSFDRSMEYRYAIRKTLGEAAVREHYPKNHVLFRSHGMRAYHQDDPIYEAYWPVRLMRGGEVIIPDAADHFAQVTDIKSLASFMVHCGETGKTGPFNVAYSPFRFSDYLQQAEKVLNPQVIYVPMDPQTLAYYKVKPYRTMPLWRPNPAGAYRFDVSRAKSAGLVNRSLTQLISDQIAGYRDRYPDDSFQFTYGPLNTEREAEIIADFKRRNEGE